MPSKNKLQQLTHLIELPALILIALACRIYFNAIILEHRVAQFGDAFYFLSAGTKLLEACQTGSIAQLFKMHPEITSGVQAMTSLSLVDRLLIDGPVFPAYLAAVQFLIGINTALPQLEAHSLQIALFNCFLDAISCGLVYIAARLAFNRRTALIAGLLFAFYPPAVINTASCYSEQFCYFLMLLWCIGIFRCAILPSRTALPGYAVWLSTGVLSGILMLAKPAFVLLPPLVVAISYWINKQRVANRPILRSALQPARTRRHIALATSGLLLVILPWMTFTALTTGKPTLVVNRVPAFNFYIGNHLESDGWRQYPLPYTPTSMNEALAMVKSTVSHHPVEFIALELRKSSRLWSGAWNTFQYSFIIDSKWQDVWHQLLLFCGLLGLLFCLKQHAVTQSRQGRAAVILATIVLFHFVYMAFEPISRYAVTAMPFIMILAAHAFTSLIDRQQSKRFSLELLILLMSVAAFITFHRFSPSLAPYLIGITGTWRGLAQLDGAIWMLSWFGIFALCFDVIKQHTGSNSQSKVLAYGIFGFVCGAGALILLASAQFGASRYEWHCQLEHNQKIVQSIRLPRSAGTDATYLLMDVSSTRLTPPLVASVNGQELGRPMPWWQFSDENEDLLGALSVQAQAMGTDISSYRQWWTVPIPSSTLKAGADNKIEIKLAPDADDALVTIYGDYPFNFSNRGVWLPSMNRTSWTKAFATICRGDPRLYEWLQPQGRITCAQLYTSEKPSADLSTDVAKQLGNYRLRLLAFNTTKKNESAISPNRTCFQTEPGKEIPVLGANPLTFRIGSADIGKVQAGTRFQVNASVLSTIPGDAYISVILSGTVDGKTVQWTSPWEPGCLTTSKRWMPVSFGDFISHRLLNANDLKATIMVSPFQTDILFLKKNVALKRSLLIKDVSLQLSAPHLVHGRSDLAFELY